MKRFLRFLFILVLPLTFAVSANAVSMSVTTDESSTVNVYNIDTWSTSGSTMGGLEITAVFADGSGGTFSETISWDAISGANGDDYSWSLTLNDMAANTWNADTEWTLSNDSGYDLVGLVMDGTDADVVFDRVFVPETTTDSKFGREITAISSSDENLAVEAVYSNLVTVMGTATEDEDNGYDLYATVTLDFSSESGGLSTGDDFVFTLDTDNVNVSIPEPATMLLMGIGLVGLAGGSRRRRKK